MNKLIPIVAAMALSSTSAFAQMATSTSTPSPAAADAHMASQATQTFVQKAEAGSHFEIEAGKLAAQQAGAKNVKQFGKMMVSDHGKAAKRLKDALLKDKKAGLPMDTAMTSEQQNDYDQLKGLNGTDFDRQYVPMMVKDHREDLKMFQDYAKTGDNPQVKTFAKKTSAVIEKHLKRIQEIQGNMQKAAQR